MRTRRALIALVLALTFALTACGSEPTALEDGGGPPGPVQSVEIVENDSLSVEILQTSDTVVAVLRDADGNPVEGDASSWEINGDGNDSRCGFWESSTITSDADGRVTNVLHAGDIAWTSSEARNNPDACRYRVVHSRDGAPEPVLDSVQVRIQPGPARNLVVDRTVEDGTRDQFGDDGPAAAHLFRIWTDRGVNPALYEAAVTSGPASVTTLEGAAAWTRAVRADGLGTGTVEVWSLPDSSRSVSATFEVTAYGPEGEERWICVTFDEWRDDSTCEGPPAL